MSRSTGPVLATGAVTLANAVILGGDQLDDDNKFAAAARVVVGTGLMAGILALVERATPDIAVALAWLGFGTLMLTRVDPNIPSPSQRLLAWWDTNRPADLLSRGVES